MLIGSETKSIIDDGGGRMISNSTIAKHGYNNAVTTMIQFSRSSSDFVITFTQVVFFMTNHSCMSICFYLWCKEKE